jgi:hypothetical protein
MRGPGRPHTTQTNQPPSLNREAAITAASSALTGLVGTVDKQAPSGEP